jgi:hypothetical protein
MIRLVLLVAFGMVAASYPVAGVHAQEPLWVISSSRGDTIFGLPSYVATRASSGSVFITDQSRKAIVELDAATGKLRRFIGREGDGPGESRAVGPIGLSPDGSLLGMYDQGRQTVEAYALPASAIARLRVGMLYFPKGILVLPDSQYALSGGHLVDEQRVASVLFVRRNSVTATGPPVPLATEGEGSARVVPGLYVAGGPLARADEGVFLAEALTGDIWHVTPEQSRKLLDGPGLGVPSMVDKFLRRVTDQGKEYLQTWFSFPQPKFLERLPDGAFIEAWSDQDHSTLSFYRLEKGRQPRLVRKLALAVYAMARYDKNSFILMAKRDGDYLIERVRLDLK